MLLVVVAQVPGLPSTDVQGSDVPPHSPQVCPGWQTRCRQRLRRFFPLQI
jgi:hypothetical protein